MKIKLKNKNWHGLTEVVFDGQNFRAWDDIAKYFVVVDHLMSEKQKKRVKNEKGKE